MQDEVAAAEKSIDEKTTQLIAKGRWMVPGYKVRFACFMSLLIEQSADPHRRRSLAILPSYNRTVPHALQLSFVYSSIVDTIYQVGRDFSTTYTPSRCPLAEFDINDV